MLKEILKLFLIWRIALIIVAYFGAGRFPLIQNGGPGAIAPNQAFDFFKSWAQWDGGHYVGIAQNGYAYTFQHAFFPIYPILIKISSIPIFDNYFLSAYLVSSLATFGSLCFLYKYAERKFSSKVAWRTIFYFLVFPSSIFLAAAYSESTFLFFTIASFYFADRKKWFWASILAGLSSGTRITGILLFPVLVFEYLQQKEFSIKKIRLDFFWIFLSPAGLLIYMYYLWQKTGDWLYFLEAQTVWDRSRSIIDPLRVLIEHWEKIVFAFDKNTTLFVISSTEFFLTTLFLILSFIVWRKINKSLGLYSIIVAVFPILTGTLLSMPRLVLINFPVFILLGIWGRNKTVDLIITIFSILFLALFTVLFINGYWLA